MTRFSGFKLPSQNWSKLPHEFMDLMATMSLAELRVVLYVLRHTWGYSEFDTPKRISVDEFMFGRKKSNGERIDRGTGLSEQSVRNGLKMAVEHGYLIVDIDDSDAGRTEKSYALSMDGSKIYTPPPKTLTSDCENLDPEHRKKPKKEKDISVPEKKEQETEKQTLTNEQVEEIVEDANRTVDGLLEAERQFMELESYPNRTKFAEGTARDFADLYVKHTGQHPITKNQVSYWSMTFGNWKQAGYSVKILDIALRLAKSQNLSITVPQSLSTNDGGLMAMVAGELRNGRTYEELYTKEEKEKPYWKLS